MGLDFFLPLLFLTWSWIQIKQKGWKLFWNQLRTFPLFWSGLGVLFLFFLSLCYAGIFLPSLDFLHAGFYLFRYTFLFLFALLVFFELSKHPEKQPLFITSIIVSAVILALMGFIQLFLYPDFRAMAEIGWDPHINRLLSTWFDPNFLGSFFSFVLSLMAGIFSFWVMKHSSITSFFTACTQKIYPLLFGLSGALLLIALLLTYSRSALLAFVIPIFILGVLYFRTVLIIGILGITLLLPFSPRAMERVSDGIGSALSITQEESLFFPDPTARLRVENFQEGVLLAQEHWFTGIGFNTIRSYKTENIHSSGGFDSSLLTVLVTSGVFGLITFLFFYWNAWKTILWKAFLETHEYKKGVQVGFLAGIIGVFAQSFFINSLFYSLFMVFVFGVMGYSLVPSQEGKK